MTESTVKAHRTVSRVTTILETVAAQPQGVRLHDLASTLDAPKSSVFGLAKGLVATGYLVEVGGTYRLGPALAHLLPGERPSLISAARPSLEQLRDNFDETATLTTPVGESMVYVATAECKQLIRYSPPLRERRPLYPPSAGKVILAHWSVRRRDAYLATKVDQALLPAVRDELDRVRVEGVAFNRAETLPNVSAAARPVISQGKVLGVLSVAGPSSRLSPTLLDEVADALATAVEDTSGRL